MFLNTVGILIGINCPLFTCLFLYSYEASFIQRLLKKKKRSQPKLSISRSALQMMSFTIYLFTFGDFVDGIYPIELVIKDTTDTDRSASYIDLHLEIYNEGRLRTILYDKREGDYFNFPSVNFPFICSNIPVAPTYRIYISELIRYSRTRSSYHYFLDGGFLQAWKLLTQV